MYAPLSSSLHWLLRRGTRRDGGSVTRRVMEWLQPEPSASTSTREPGTRTPATAISEECSLWQLPTVVLADGETAVLTLTILASSFTEPGSSIDVTVTRGVSGGLRALAASGDPEIDAVWIDGVERLADAWERANREALE